MNCRKFLLIFVSFLSSYISFAQLGETFDIERPEKYADKKIGYENTYTKKYALPRKFLQNTTSHYNFYFNANEKLKLIIANAKEAQKDTFDRLLNYFPYTLDYTKNQKNDLDSVIQKASGGILLHDLRSNWVDNFYLLIGKAYLLQQKYDSAEMTFNYINYEYAPKTKDKERILTGSNSDEENRGDYFSIATKEKKGVVNKLIQRPPSRNEAFLWMLRTHIENGDYGSAAGIAQTLKNDPIFPSRLRNDLDELTGFLFYKQLMYDSAALYLSKSMSMSEGKNDKARREFLTGQLYELANKPALASDYYASSVKHTLDPVMEVYARLNSIKIRKSNDPKVIDDNIAALLKMGKKDAYEDYRDIIFFFAGKMEQERNNTIGAINNYLKSVEYSTNNIGQKNKSFLALANIAYQDKKYRFASNYYDSLNIADPSLNNIDEINSRKVTLKKLVNYIETVELEDSLQTIAAMPINERDDYIKKLLRRLRKEQGLKEDANNLGTSNNTGFANNAPTNLFENSSGEWYFYNNTAKNRGNSEFKRLWGNRPNVDNWRRAASMGQSNVNGNNNRTNNITTDPKKKQATELTLDALTNNLPLTPNAITASNDTIQNALLAMGKLYQFELDDTPAAIETYENLIKRFPKHPKMDEVLYNLYVAYNKIGETQKANLVKSQLDKNFKESKYVKPENNNSLGNNVEATKAYTQIYNLFVEGNFEKAIELKRIADTKYGPINWSPQLMYIEAIYYVKQRQDTLAINSLDVILRLYPTSNLAPKAAKLKDVINRRKSIETELQNLQVTRTTENPIVIQDNKPATTVINKPVTPANNTVTPPVTNNPKPVVVKQKDTVAKVNPAVNKPKYPYKTDNTKEHYVAVWLNKVDNVFVNEARNAFVIYNRGTGRTLRVDNTPIDAENKFLLIQSFPTAEEAITYITNAQAKVATEIMPWLAKEKYSFLIINDDNLKLVFQNKDIVTYKNYLIETFPGKFQ